MRIKSVNIPFKKYHTHCVVYGDINKKAPIILLHGGPGGCSERYEPLSHLVNCRAPIIFYDQLGCGYSRVPKEDKVEWTTSLFIEEFNNLISYFKLKEFFILGHSWGGMLALEMCTSKHIDGLKGLILFSTLPSTKIWNDEHMRLVDESQMSNNLKKAVRCKYEGKPFNPLHYKKASKAFAKSHVKLQNKNAYVPIRKRYPKLNLDIYVSMWGKDEVFGTGTLIDYDVTNRLNKIDVPTLILSGKFDESTPKMNELMNNKIKGSQWILLNKSAHCGYRDEPKKTLDIISKWYRKLV